MMKARSGESGNVLWFIMIAIVLIGLLTIVLSRSSTSVDQSGDVEQGRVLASQILRTAKSYESAIQQMRLRGVSEGDISFQRVFTAGADEYENAACGDPSAASGPSNDDCFIFGVGGGLTYTPPPAGSGAADWIFTGANNVEHVGRDGAGSGNDLLMMLEGVSASLCGQINRLSNIGGSVPEDGSGLGREALAPYDLLTFDGAYQPDTLYTIDGTGSELSGRSAGCFTDTAVTPNVTYFYAVILER